MHLSVARLCLDCQEIHDEDRCPVCTSEAFGFMTRWVKVDAPVKPTSPHPATDLGAARVEGYRQILNPTPPQSSRAARWLRRGSLVVAAGYLARLGWQVAQNRRVPQGNAPDPSAGAE